MSRKSKPNSMEAPAQPRKAKRARTDQPQMGHPLLTPFEMEVHGVILRSGLGVTEAIYQLKEITDGLEAIRRQRTDTPPLETPCSK